MSIHERYLKLRDLQERRDAHVKEVKARHKEELDLVLESYAGLDDDLESLAQQIIERAPDKSFEKSGHTFTVVEREVIVVDDPYAVGEWVAAKGADVEIIKPPSFDKRKLNKLVETFRMLGEKVPGVTFDNRKSLSVK